MKYTKTLTALAATGAIGLAAAPVLAQDDATAPPGDATEQGREDAGTADREAERADRRAAEQAEFAAALAAELGIDEDEVSAALTTVMEERRAAREAARDSARQERLDAAVEDGTLTQEQADALAELGDVGVTRGRGGPFGRGGHGGPGGDGGPDGDGGPGRDGGTSDGDRGAATAPDDEATPDA